MSSLRNIPAPGAPDSTGDDALLDSQLETLEPLEADEAGVLVDSEGGVEATAARALAALR